VLHLRATGKEAAAFEKGKSKTMNTTIRNGELFCLNCGGSHKLIMPIPVDKMITLIEAFNVLHKNCEKTWTEPVPDQSKDTQAKAMFWLQHGERGMSSETMWHCCMGNRVERVSYPYDPDDFSRCYKLLQCVPEWKDKKYMQRIASLCPEWKNLIDNWDKLTDMYEENVRTQWKNYKKIGMYDLMQKCIGR